MAINELLSILGSIIFVVVATVLLRVINLSRINRSKQFLSTIFSPIYAVISFLLIHAFQNKLLAFSFYSDLQPVYKNLLLNSAIVVVFLIIKAILLPIMALLWNNETIEQTSEHWYVLDPDYDIWFLKPETENVQKLYSALGYAVSFICILVFVVSHFVYKNGVTIIALPAIALVVITEFSSFLFGYTKEAYLRLIGGEDISSTHRGAYFKLRNIFDDIFHQNELFSLTGNDFKGKDGASVYIQNMESSEDRIDRLVGGFFSHMNQKTGFYDVDLVSATSQMLHGESVVILDPFYRDLGDYLLLPIMNSLINDKKCLVIVGRQPLTQDIIEWLRMITKNYSKTKNLWKVGELTTRKPNCEIGVLPFSGIYDTNLITKNKEFLDNVDFVIFIEPSKLLSTFQTGLGILADRINEHNKPVYCICDHNVDGLVDTVSHVLHINLTNVFAQPTPRTVYSAMGWDSAGDFIRQKLFGKQTRFLGNGAELAAVALRNQVRHVSWFSSEKAPVKDIKWITGQYYPLISKYSHLPSQQSSIDDRITFSCNLWESDVTTESFVIAEDEFCNMFETVRLYLSRGKEQSFVNVISENYLLRDYMRLNSKLFISDPKAIPAIAPAYVKTERNTVLKLILMMASEELPEEAVKHELTLIDTTNEDRGMLDIYNWLSELIKKYTFNEVNVVSVLPKTDREVIIPEEHRYYSISPEDFATYFSRSLMNAYFVVEDEKFGTEYIDARLFEHICQLVMPGQYVTYGGKYYKVHALLPKVGCVLHRASDEYFERLYYRQIRTYHIGESTEIVNSKKISDVELSTVRLNFSCDTSGYIELKNNCDLRTAKIIDLSSDPGIDVFHREYKNKVALKIVLPETDKDIRFTISMLMSELFRTLFPDSWQYLAVLSSRPDIIDGMLKTFGYSIDGNYDENAIYVIEDSNSDLGLIEAVENNIIRIFEILTDYLDWHFEEITKPAEPEIKRTRAYRVDVENSQEKKQKNLLRRVGFAIRNAFGGIFGKKTKEEEPVTVENAAEPTEKEIGSSDEQKKPADPSKPFVEIENKEQKLAPIESDVDVEFIVPDVDSKTESDKSDAEESKQDETKETVDISIPPEEQIVIHQDGEDLFSADGVSDDLDVLMPIRPSKYQKECFLKLGFDEIDSRLRIEDVRSYLSSRGWSNNALTKARKRDDEGFNYFDMDSVQCCDFCRRPLTGVSYDRLTDGRICCSDCSTTAINDVAEFRKVYHDTERLMKEIFNIKFPVNITIRTTDAKTIAKHAGSVYTPTTKFANRVLGFAQRKHGKYVLYIENGSPRIAAVSTIAHELTHIWQYLNWKDDEIIGKYNMSMPECTLRCRDIVYEGMAVWAQVQLLYCMGETSYAQVLDQMSEARRDVYGRGFYLYKDLYGLKTNGETPEGTPFMGSPVLEVSDVVRESKGLCCREKCEC